MLQPNPLNDPSLLAAVPDNPVHPLSLEQMVQALNAGRQLNYGFQHPDQIAQEEDAKKQMRDLAMEHAAAMLKKGKADQAWEDVHRKVQAADAIRAGSTHVIPGQRPADQPEQTPVTTVPPIDMSSYLGQGAQVPAQPVFGEYESDVLKHKAEEQALANQRLLDLKKAEDQAHIAAENEPQPVHPMLASTLGLPAGAKLSKEDLNKLTLLKSGELSRQSKTDSQNAGLDTLLGNAPAPKVLPGSPMYKVARQLAFGEITPTQAQQLLRTRGMNAPVLATSLFNTAQDLNPEWTPAAAELGYQFARTPQVRRQVAAMDNVRIALPNLLRASDEAARTNVPLLNKVLLPAGYNLGDKSYANLKAATTAFADELSLALGTGTASDLKTKMGVDLTDPNLSPAALSEMMRKTVIPFAHSRKQSLLNQMGPFAHLVDKFGEGDEWGGGPQSTEPAPPGAKATSHKIGETKTFAQGPYAGKTGVWNGQAYEIQ